jgi:hypothetical protein
MSASWWLGNLLTYSVQEALVVAVGGLTRAVLCLRRCEKIDSVMLSAAKHLHYLLEKKEMQMLRCAQHDRAGRFFHTF